MTLVEALRELGLEPGADAETVRRAYARLVKTRKPEQDPEGFQRLRDAYETARGGAAFEALATGSAPIVFAPPTAAGSASSPRAEAPEPPAAPPDPFAALERRWTAALSSGDPREPLTIARDAVAALPDDPRAHWLLARALSRSEDEAALADALRAASRRGWPDFLLALLIRLPDRSNRHDVDAAFDSDLPRLRLAAAAVAAQWASRRAAGVVIDLCRSAMDAAPEEKGDRARALPVAGMLDVVVALQAAGALDPAREAQAALRACLRDTGLELALLQTPVAGLWTLAEEIDGLPADFPPGLRAAFAQGARQGDLTIAFWATSVEQTRSGADVGRWVDQLSGSAVNVAHTMRAALEYQPVPVARRSMFRSPALVLVYCVLPGLLLAAAIAILSATTKHDVPPLH